MARANVPEFARSFDRSFLLFLLAAAVYLYGFLFLPPFTPIYTPGDGLVYLGDAQRMWYGQIIYRDFFQFSTPGTALADLCMFRIFGLRSWIPNLALLLLGVALAGLGVVVARKVMRPGLAFLPSTIFLVGVYRNLLDSTHHWYSLLAATAAVAVLMERRTPARIAAAGGCCGLALCFTQARGAAMVIALAVFLGWESRRRKEIRRELLKKQALLLAGFLAIAAAVNGYFVGKAGPVRFLWCTVVFGLKYHHLQADANSFGVIINDLPHLAMRISTLFRLGTWVLIDLVVPLAALLFLGYYWRSKRRGKEEWERPMLLALASFFLILNVAPAPASIRTASSSLPGIVLLVWFADSPRRVWRALAAAATATLLLLLPHGVARIQSVPREVFALPRGPLAISDRDMQEKYAWLLPRIHAAEYVYEPADPDLYFYLDLRNPTPLPRVANCGYTPPAQVAEAIRGLEEHPARYIVWSPVWADAVADWEKPEDNHLGPLRDYIRRHYRKVKSLGNTEEGWESRGTHETVRDPL